MALIGHWKLDGNAQDSSGNDIHGSITNTNWVEGVINQCAEFTGSDSWIDLGNSLYLPNNHPFSLTGWMMFYSFDSRDMLMCRNEAVKSAGPYTWLLGTQDGARISAYDGGDWHSIDYNFELNRWYHLGFIFDGSEMKFYINGKMVGSKPWTFSDSETGRNTQIGGYSGSTGDVDGKVDDVRFYDHALSLRDISYLQNTPPSLNQENQINKNLILHYGLDSSTNDSSGNENHGETKSDTAPQPVEERVLGKGAYEFNGVNTYIKSNNLFSYEEITFSFWFKTFDTSSYGTLVNLFKDTSNGWGVRHANDRLLIYSDILGDDANIYDYTISSDTWYFVVASLKEDGTNILYVNGELVGDSFVVGDNTSSFTAPIFLGQRGNDSSYFNGLLDDFRMYAAVLSTGEVLELYQTRARIDSNGNLNCKFLEEPKSILLIEQQTKTVYDNTYKSMGGWDVYEKDVSDFVESDNTLGNVYVDGWVYISSTEYVLTRFEYTKENNTKGVIITSPSYTDQWQTGWNYIRFEITEGYVDADNTPWHDMTRLEFYRSGESEGVDTSQYITIKNLRLNKYADNGEIKNSLTNSGVFRYENFSELGPAEGLVGYWPFNGNIEELSDKIVSYSTTGSLGITIENKKSALYLPVNSSLDIDHNNLYSNSSITFMFWIWHDTDPTGSFRQIFGNESPRGAGSFWFRGDDNRLHNSFMRDSGSNGTCDTTNEIPKDVWTHIAATYDQKGNDLVTKIYINGEINKEVIHVNNSLVLGQTSSSFIGRDHKIYQYRVYNRALSNEEINILHEMYSPDTPKLKSSNNTLYATEFDETF